MTYQKHKHGRVPLCGKVGDDFNRFEMVPESICTVTERICDLISTHDMGMIDNEIYTQELRAIQAEFLT